MNGALGISIIVCCYNSASRLPTTLEHIALQESVQDIDWELIIVDNNSTDNTSSAALRIWTDLNKNIPFKIVIEQNAGLSYAREKGIAESRFNFLLFCDDDNWLDANYISKAYSIMLHDSNIGILGGQSKAAFDTQPPVWFERYGQAYAIGKPLLKTGKANHRKFIAGAAMVVKKSIFKELENLSFKQVLSDRKGIDLSSGGDTELCAAALLIGYDLHYDERLHFTHYMPANRLEWQYCVRMVSEGHAVPKIYMALYEYCKRQLSENKKLHFDHAINILRKKYWREIYMLLHKNNYGYPLKLLIKSEPGSRKEIDLKAAMNSLRFLLFKRKKLKQDFQIIRAFVKKVNLKNKAVHPLAAHG